MLDFLTLPYWAGVAALVSIGSLLIAARKRQKQKEPDQLKRPTAQQALADFSDRFLSIFTSHDIEITQIPWYVPSLSLADLATSENWLPCLRLMSLRIHVRDYLGEELLQHVIKHVGPIRTPIG